MNSNKKKFNNRFSKSNRRIKNKTKTKKIKQNGGKCTPDAVPYCIKVETNKLLLHTFTSIINHKDWDKQIHGFPKNNCKKEKDIIVTIKLKEGKRVLSRICLTKEGLKFVYKYFLKEHAKKNKQTIDNAQFHVHPPNLSPPPPIIDKLKSPIKHWKLMEEVENEIDEENKKKEEKREQKRARLNKIEGVKTRNLAVKNAAHNATVREQILSKVGWNN
jgi:hypothetical protein